jgi:chromosome partitioning protein
MRVITLLNEKGGVGKTTLATHIAAGLAVKGQRVLLVDSDPQGHATVAMGVARGPGLYNLLVRDAAFTDVIQLVSPEVYQTRGEVPGGSLHVISSNEETRAIPLLTSDGMVVLRRLREIESVFDVVLFDTSPTPSLLHSAIYMATHAIVYPTECEYLSLDGLGQSFKHREDLQPMRQQYGLGLIDVLGIVPTKYRSSTLLHNNNLERLQKRFGKKVWEPLTLATIWGEASMMRQMVFTLAPESRAAQEIWGVVERVQEGLVS